MARDHSLAFSPAERRAAISLSGIFALRMLGLFLVLPVFAVYASSLQGATPALIGLALGGYGLTQALLQIPYGTASDRLGRKKVITFGLLLFAMGSFICAQAATIEMMIVGRLLQGSGAIASAIIALMADLTREENRTRAMAMLGGSIALSFAVGMVAGPIIGARWGVDIIFYLIGALATLAIPYLWLAVPNPAHVKHHRDMELTPADLKTVLADSNLRRLDFGVFVLHMAMTAVFVSVPVMLTEYMAKGTEWKVYVPVMLISFTIMVPTTILAEVKGKIRQVVLAGIAMIGVSCVIFLFSADRFPWVVAGLSAFFIGFNMLEPVLPSLVTKFAPTGARGTTTGVYSTCQFLGPFVGGALGGILLQSAGHSAVFIFVLVAVLAWFLVARGMQVPIPYRQVVVPLPGLSTARQEQVAGVLRRLDGVGDVRLFADEGEAHVRFISKKIDVAAIFDAAQKAAGNGAS